VKKILQTSVYTVQRCWSLI